MELLAPNPPVREFDTILLWPFSLQGQGALFAEREKRDSSPAAWLKKYAQHIEGGKSGWQRVENPLEEYFGVPHLYQPHQPHQQHAEFVYLHPFIQKLLYESDSRHRAMEVLVRKDICQLKVELSRNPAHMAGQPEGAPNGSRRL